ncbi:hypothetical protein TSUD_11890 [Trifolium subterraneum]|uniref:Replication protein A 70 kDa DNA-binding subunit B/D first OB fold domain-containing protein n=1 Tax=Trifolium subterraneum TaxID=3900 RepID=A0A2Z6MCQ1_TRISU|nr:hypothetical protein TSUD_11890 [Trifolium subterraneum]
MSRVVDDVKSVNDSKELWKLAVRLEDIWTVTNGGQEHLEFLILDKQGDQIQVLLPSEICPMWKTSLKEGETYVMKNFKVHKNDFYVMSCVHPFKTQFMDFFNAKSDDGPMIIVINHAQIKEPQVITKLSSLSVFSSITLCLAMPCYVFNAPPKHLPELMTCANDEVVTTIETLHHVLTTKHILLTCADCKKQIITTSPPYKCSNEHVTPDPQIKYKVHVEICFQGLKGRFVFWDRECQQLIGKTAEELKTIMIEAGEFDRHEYPAALDDMMGKELAFKVNYYKLVSVLNYKTEEAIIQYLKDKISNNEVIQIINLYYYNKLDLHYYSNFTFQSYL